MTGALGLWLAMVASPPTLNGNRAAELLSLEAEVTVALDDMLPRDEELHILLGQIWTLAEREPSRAAATLRLRLGEVTTSRQRAWLWLELGRLEEHVGRRPEARAAYLAAASEAQQTHVLTNAIERFVAASESDSDGIAKLPNLHRYLERVGREDISARRILYRLAKSLVGARLRSAAIVLTDIRGDDAVARRSHYVHGAALLLRGQSKNALTSFRRAAEMDVKNSDERDRAVRDHAWLALARLAQESADVSEAIYAYHQIPIDSKLATTALLELGMLALEDGHSLTATAAFESLIATHEQDLGPRAALLQGYVLIEKGEFDAAAAHYDSIATDFETNLAAFDRAVGTVDDPYDLVRECTERQRAAASAALAPVLERPELERARSLFALEDEIEKLKLNLEEQRQALRALATPETPGPLREIAERIARLEALLRRTNTLAAARGKPRWRVASAAPDRCCTLPSDRIRTLRDRLETALTRARARREEIMATIAEEQAHADALAAELTRTGGAIAAEIRQEQTVLARQALDAHRQVLENLALEGRAGGLEALWAAKEVLSPRIYALEQKRQDALQEHYENHRDVIIELESAE